MHEDVSPCRSCERVDEPKEECYKGCVRLDAWRNGQPMPSGDGEQEVVVHTRLPEPPDPTKPNEKEVNKMGNEQPVTREELQKELTRLTTLLRGEYEPMEAEIKSLTKKVEVWVAKIKAVKQIVDRMGWSSDVFTGISGKISKIETVIRQHSHNGNGKAVLTKDIDF